ncbi:rCG37072 [Rattus norvegicus]|uniref:RCG37072 n=1 Tax=Rattus norvegicus TaxID=10116 RepID=A6HTR3_RAT|nr:rCG37072 [Rattus norvegicus]
MPHTGFGTPDLIYFVLSKKEKKELHREGLKANETIHIQKWK